jgi:hypothetical protein
MVTEGSKEAFMLKMAGEQIQEMVMSGRAAQPSNGYELVDQGLVAAGAGECGFLMKGTLITMMPRSIILWIMDHRPHL